MQTCINCNEEKELHQFDKLMNKKTKNIYVRKVCRKCRNKKYLIDRYLKNEEKYKMYNDRKCNLIKREEYKVYRRAVSSLNSSITRIILKIVEQRKKDLLQKDYILKNHLESLFTPEMNWLNYGSYWQVDHIISGIKLAREGQPIEVINHISNLRPLTKYDNNTRDRKKPNEYSIYPY